MIIDVILHIQPDVNAFNTQNVKIVKTDMERTELEGRHLNHQAIKEALRK